MCMGIILIPKTHSKHLIIYIDGLSLRKLHFKAIRDYIIGRQRVEHGHTQIKSVPDCVRLEFRTSYDGCFKFGTQFRAECG